MIRDSITILRHSKGSRRRSKAQPYGCIRVVDEISASLRHQVDNSCNIIWLPLQKKLFCKILGLFGNNFWEGEGVFQMASTADPTDTRNRVTWQVR